MGITRETSPQTTDGKYEGTYRKEKTGKKNTKIKDGDSGIRTDISDLQRRWKDYESEFYKDNDRQKIN